MSTPSRAEWLSRERDDLEREEFRLRKLRTRPELLAEVAEQIASGELTVRTATEAERARFGIKPAGVDRRHEQFVEVVTSVTTSTAVEEIAAIRTPSQRAALFIQRVDWGSEPVLTVAELAEEAGVATRTVERCLRVKEADPELFQKLVEGSVSATRADDQISRMEGKGG